MNHRKIAFLRVDSKWVVELLNGAAKGKLTLPSFRGESLPPDTEVLCVMPHTESNSIQLLIWSDSFPEVPLGQMAPVLLRCELMQTVELPPLRIF